jgi:SAM-dependent methyltransferase
VTSTSVFEPRRFRSTAVYYAKYRVPYPHDLIAMVAQRTGLRAGDHVLDLGCGPGSLAVAFARLGVRVTAMDPEPEMLDAARAAAQAMHVELTVRQGSSYDLGPELGRFRLVVMGRSFHWMDRQATLLALGGLIETGGAVALFHDRRVLASPDWSAVVEALSEQFSPLRSADRRRRKGPDWQPHEAILLRSPFAHLERMARISERSIDIEDVVGRTFSMSVTSPEALGSERDAFEAALRAELLRLEPSGRFKEIVEVSALLGFRSAPAVEQSEPVATEGRP